MKIESKMSGWTVTGFSDIPTFPHLGDQVVTLLDIDNLSERAAQWILDNYNIVPLRKEIAGCNYGVVMSFDDIVKVNIMEYAPEAEKELAEYFKDIGDWRKVYLRFGH